MSVGPSDVIGVYITDPNTMVKRNTRGTVSGGLYTDGPFSYFFLDLSIRPDSGASLDDDPEGQVVTEVEVAYNNEQALWTRTHDTLATEGHDADVVYRNAIEATLALGSVTPHVDTVLASVITGPDGNGVTLQLISGAVPAAGVLNVAAWPACTFTFLAGTTTVAQLEAAVEALSGPSLLLAVETPGTQGNVLQAGDVLAATNFSGGDAELWRAVKAKQYRAFWKVWIERTTRP
jgi:hypothetical protein